MRSKIALRNPHRIPDWLTRKDLHKKVKIYLDNGDTVTGKLIDYNSEQLILRKKHSKEPETYLFSRVERMEIVTRHDTYLTIAAFSIFILFLKFLPSLGYDYGS